jgi:23S rRNA (pseudouridine1915-N3)-methyltransferase
MKITIYCVGTLKEVYWRAAVDEYVKRLTPYTHISIVEVPDIAYKEGAGTAIETKVKDEECAKFLNKIKPGDYVCALDLNQKEYDSVAFSEHLQDMAVRGGSSISFLIGGSLGLSDAAKKRANESISFSQMTFTHQMSRVILLEQLYRAFKIAHHEPYHK